MSFPFTKNQRILRKRDYAKVRSSGLRKVSLFTCIDYRLGLSPNPMLGITVPSSFGNAVMRNRFKRKVREAFRKVAHLLPPALEINVYPRHKAKIAKTDEIQKEILTLKDL